MSQRKTASISALVFTVLFVVVTHTCGCGGGVAVIVDQDGAVLDTGYGQTDGAVDGGTVQDAQQPGDAQQPSDAQYPDDAGIVDDGGGQGDAGPGDAGTDDAGAQDGGAGDGGKPFDGGAGDAGPSDGGSSTYNKGSLASCWTDAKCGRVLSIAHGGAWSALGAPYLSNAAITKAYDVGCDGVKIDVRVSSDNIPVLAHSSPIEFYESVLCTGKKIEEMKADEVTKCIRAPSLTEKFQRLDDVLNYLRGKMTAQLCVKRSQDYQRTIDEIHALGAEDFAFIELGSAAELKNIIPTLTGADTVWYLVNVRDSLSDVDLLLNVIMNPRAFMFEFDPTVDVSTLTPTRLHPAGVRSFVYDDSAILTVSKTQGYFEGGYDVISSQSAENNVEARKAVNTARGISPP
jgi:hypothetical protein